ncbi:diguanylate cyclase [Aliihoeflea aestuarii]|uniref:GGDEF domain-containing protein n=1 Tax=Aliihoeflea aestuarii TaxID=453840 RepID=UPI0020961E9B|nr:diguanylate cyclase [Aliihoeflea aestuarii]MCO6392149.1 diguanylate cyclase [Aliihoeflea aestuarii]
MTGELAFKLLNPAISLVLVTTFLTLWFRHRSHTHLLMLAGAFTLSGIAFAANDFLHAYDGPALRVFVNGLFLAAILGACLSAFVRARMPVPLGLFAAVVTAGATGFSWFLFVEPSTPARIYIVNATFAVIATITGYALIRAKPRSAVDWMFVGLAGFIFTLAIARPVATFMDRLDINPGGPIGASAYWATIQALTPLLALTIALSFLAAFAVQIFAELRNQAERDYLTGLLNRRGFDMQAARSIDAVEGTIWQPALMVVDIDNFKMINDTFGHGTGDRVIAAVARALATHAGADIVGRMGGEEFALFYNRARRGELAPCADALRREIGRLRIVDLPAGYPLTVSIGIHPRHQSQTLSEMMKQADQALYAAKSGGKDQALMTALSLNPVPDKRDTGTG